jgi:hypothetical protein
MHTDNPHNPEQPFVASSLALSFGSWDSAEFLSTRFQRRPFLTTFPHFVLSGDGDTFLQLTHWRAGFIDGVLFSRTFGRVGTVELIRNERPTAPAAMPIVAPVGAGYRGPAWGFSLASRPDPSAATALYPRVIAGRGTIYGTGSDVAIGFENVVSGRYDPYANALGLELEDGRMATGFFDADLNLFVPSAPRVQVLVVDHATARYRRTSN